MWARFGKRPFDLVMALALGVFLAPVMLGVAAIVALRMGQPVLFWQERPGRGERLFPLVKFRTMSTAAGPDAERLTSLGQFLRRASLDELPELWNVIRGDMSLVGPRPLIKDYLPRYSVLQGRRHEVRPGITGWAQVNGRNAISWEQKFALDVWYVDHQTFLLDMKILLLTAWQALRGRDINHPGATTMPEFMGTTRGER